MTTRETPRLSALVVAAMSLLVTIGAGIGIVSDHPDRRTGSSPVTIAASGITPAGLLDTRIERDGELQNGQKAPRQLSVCGPTPSSARPARWARAVAEVPTRAGHQRRHGPICLRGPPASSV